MNDFISYAIFGLVQGLTEFLPVSSSGHLVIAHELLGITSLGLSVDAVLQLATALAIVVYFWKDLLSLLYAVLYKLTGRPHDSQEFRLALTLIIATVPALIFGLLLESTMETIFRNAHLVAYALIAGSIIMLAAEFASKRFGTHASMKEISVLKGVTIGLFQSLALIPGMSRSGMTISGGLFLGLSREAAARFGFLLAVPIVAGSGLKKLVELWWGGELAMLGIPLFLGSVVAFLSGLIAIHILLLFVRTQPLYAFVVYRVALAAAILTFI